MKYKNLYCKTLKRMTYRQKKLFSLSYITVPPEILARGSSALEAYKKALADGETSVRRVPIMLIGQDRAGKTSLKKSLKGFVLTRKKTVLLALMWILLISKCPQRLGEQERRIKTRILMQQLPLITTQQDTLWKAYRRNEKAWR